MKKFFCLFMSVMMVFAMSAGISAKTVSMSDLTTDGGLTFSAAASNDVVNISSGEEMALFAAYTNSGKLTRNVKFYLQNDIDLSAVCHGESAEGAGDGVNWTPIGTSTVAFNGMFYGQGHTIGNLYINSTEGNQGLFGYTGNHATINNLKVADAKLTVGNNSAVVIANCNGGTSISGLNVTGATIIGCNCGGVIGTATMVNLADCSFDGTISGANNTGNNGGIVCVLNNGGSITGCSTSETTVINEEMKKGSVHGGGILYKTTADSGKSYSFSLKKCVNRATVNGCGSGYVGGIVGSALVSAGTLTIEDCENYGAVNGGYAAGMVAGSYFPSLTVKNCMNSGAIYGTASYVGGIGGYLDFTDLLLENCTNSGDVTYNPEGKSQVSYGGIAGFVYGESTTLSACFNSGDVSNGSRTGGVIGYLQCASGVMEDCGNTGSVNGKAKDAGGVLGYARINSVDAMLILRNCYSVAETVKADSHPGGLIGTVERNSRGGLEEGDAVYVDNCYCITDSIIGEEAGAVLGSVTGVIEEVFLNNVFYRALSDTPVVGSGSVYGEASSCSDAEMKTAEFAASLGGHFRGDDAEKALNSGYPVLLVQVGEKAPALKGSAMVSVVVRDGENVMEPTEFAVYSRNDKKALVADNGVYELEPGEYLYRVWVQGYERICNSFIVGENYTGDVVFDLTLSPCEEGTRWNPYQITTVEELQQLSLDVKNGTTYAGEYVRLMNDLDLSGVEWLPIGRSYNYSFCGHFDGGNYAIKNLTVRDYRYAGLFGYLGQGGELENIHVIDGDVSGADNVGGIVGFNGNYPGSTAYYSISNCYFNGKVTGKFSGSLTHNYYSVGGIAGGSLSGIRRCGVEGEIIATGNNGNAGAGGIAGTIGGGNESTSQTYQQNSASVVSDCWFAGNISGNLPRLSLGGIVGRSGYGSSGTVERCYAVGTLDQAADNASGNGTYGISLLKSTACFALESSIDGWMDIDRTTPSAIARVSSKDGDSYAYLRMVVNDGATVAEDGTDIAASALLSAGAYLNSGWNSRIWTFVNGYLPSIEGMPAPSLESYDYLRSNTKYFTVTFETNGGSAVAPIVMLPDNMEEPAAPTREGYTFAGWYSDKACTVAFDFESLLTKDTVIYAKWDKIAEIDPEPTPTPMPTPEPTPAVSFGDVQPGDWFYEDVMSMVEQGIMNGMGNDLFAPEEKLSRAMIVTMLYRLEREPEVSGNIAFSDVAAEQWYADAVLWASENGIAKGYENGAFLPERSITREEMSVFLYRYAQYKGYDLSETADFSGYGDADKVGSWATEAMKWFVGSGLIKGRSETELAPQGDATRAEAATVFHRFLQMNED